MEIGFGGFPPPTVTLYLVPVFFENFASKLSLSVITALVVRKSMEWWLRVFIGDTLAPLKCKTNIFLILCYRFKKIKYMLVADINEDKK